MQDPPHREQQPMPTLYDEKETALTFSGLHGMIFLDYMITLFGLHGRYG